LGYSPGTAGQASANAGRPWLIENQPSLVESTATPNSSILGILLAFEGQGFARYHITPRKPAPKIDISASLAAERTMRSARRLAADRAFRPICAIRLLWRPLFGS